MNKKSEEGGINLERDSLSGYTHVLVMRETRQREEVENRQLNEKGEQDEDEEEEEDKKNVVKLERKMMNKSRLVRFSHKFYASSSTLLFFAFVAMFSSISLISPVQSAGIGSSYNFYDNWEGEFIRNDIQTTYTVCREC